MEVIKVKGKEYGKIQDTIFIKYVDGNKHKLRKPSGWAIDENVAAYAKESGVEEIIIIDYAKGMDYGVSIEKFFEYGIPIDRGYGSQIALPDRYWK
jgi:hypothetical protein